MENFKAKILPENSRLRLPSLGEVSQGPYLLALYHAIPISLARRSQDHLNITKFFVVFVMCPQKGCHC